MAGAWWRDSDYELFDRLKRERDEAQALLADLKAQVEAARTTAEHIVKTQWRVPDCYITATAVLRAMDKAAEEYQEET